MTIIIATIPVASWFLIAAGVIIALLGVPLMRRRVPPNGLYGLRVPATLGDERVWYEANARSGRDLIWYGVTASVLSAALGLSSLTDPARLLIPTGFLFVGAIALAVRGIAHANRLARKGQDPSS